MAKKVILKDLNDIEVLPITRGELVLDASGNPALHSTLFLATDSLPGLMSSEDKYKLDHLEESGPGANNKVAQINTTTNDVYRLLFSETADDTDRTEKSRKSANLTFNPSTGVLNLTGVINASGGTLTISSYEDFIIKRNVGGSFSGITYSNVDEVALGYIGIGGALSTYPYQPMFVTREKESHKIWHSGNDGTGSGLDADLLDGQHASYFATAASLNNYVTLTTALTILGVKTFSTQLKFTVADGTAPLVVASTTKVDNLNADLLDGFHMRQGFTKASDITNTAMFWQASGNCSDVSSMGYAALINVNGDTGRRWQIWNSRNNHQLFWRPEKSDMSDWADVHVLLDNYNFKDYVANMYWANVPISATSNDKTTPTFSNTIINGTLNINSGNTREVLTMDSTNTNGAIVRISLSGTPKMWYGYSPGLKGIYWFNANDTGIFLSDTNHVGIGINTPITKFHVLGTGSFEGNDDTGINLYADAGYTRIRFFNNAKENKATIHYFGTAYSGYAFAKDSLNLGCTGLVTLGGWNNPTLIVSSNTTTSNSDGKVGIGTTSPGHKLQVNGRIMTSFDLVDGIIIHRATAGAGAFVRYLANNQTTKGWRAGSLGGSNDFTFEYSSDTFSTTTQHMLIKNTGDTYIYGNLNIGASDTRNYIAFRGTTGYNPGSFNLTYIGENIWASSESSELVLFKGNDVATTATTPTSVGPDRIRHIAGGHLFQIYKSALSGTFADICTSTVPVNMLAISLSFIQAYAPVVIDSGSSGEKNAPLTLMKSGLGDYLFIKNNDSSTNTFIRGSLSFPNRSVTSGLGWYVFPLASQFTNILGNTGSSYNLDSATVTFGLWNEAHVYIDSRNDRVGIKTVKPSYNLDVRGSIYGEGITCNELTFYTRGIGTYNRAWISAKDSLGDFVIEAPLTTDSSSGTRAPITLTWRGGYTSKGGLKITGHSEAVLGGNKIWHAGNDGSGSGLDADLLDGTHKTGLLTALSSSSSTNLSITVGGTTKSITNTYATNITLISCYNGTTNNDLWSTIKTGNSTYLGTANIYEVYNDGGPTTYGEVLDIVSVHTNHWLPLLWFGAGKTGHLYYRNKDYNDATWGSWKQIAFTSDIPNPANYYWANVPISATSNATTTPTFGSVTVPLSGLIVGSKSTDTSPTRVLMCYDTTLVTKYINIGNDPSAGNAGEFHYTYSASASASNNVGMGFYAGNRLKLYYNGGSGVGKVVIASAERGGTEYELLHAGNHVSHLKGTYLRKVTVANNTTNDFNTFENMTLTGRGDPVSGASLSNAPWSGSGPAGGYGVLTYLWSSYGVQVAFGYKSNRVYIRPRYYSSGSVWATSWNSFALSSDLGSYVKKSGDTMTGNLTAPAFYASSDINLKTNIQEILNSDKMPIIKEFDWKEDNSHSYGLIAQELEEQGYSELVENSGDHKTVNYSAALSLIVGKLQVKIKELEKEIEILKNKN